VLTSELPMEKIGASDGQQLSRKVSDNNI
jgi:hypothetical protein